MTPQEYEKRIEGLGFESGAAWAEFVGVDRTTHFRHLQREEGPPLYLQLVVRLLELCPAENPNTEKVPT